MMGPPHWPWLSLDIPAGHAHASRVAVSLAVPSVAITQARNVLHHTHYLPAMQRCIVRTASISNSSALQLQFGKQLQLQPLPLPATGNCRRGEGIHWHSAPAPLSVHLHGPYSPPRCAPASHHWHRIIPTAGTRGDPSTTTDPTTGTA